MVITASTHILVLTGRVYNVARTIFRLAPVLADNSLLDPAVQSQPQRSHMLSLKEEQLMPRLPVKATRRRRKPKGKSKGKGRQTKPTAKSGDVAFDEKAQAEHEEQEESHEQDEEQEDDPEAYLVAAQTSTSESEMDSDGMLDWSASECKDYKDCVATVACASPDSFSTLKDTWEWRGPCCLVRVHRQLRRCLCHTYMEGRHLAGLDSPASTNHPCKAPGSVLLESSH